MSPRRPRHNGTRGPLPAVSENVTGAGIGGPGPESLIPATRISRPPTPMPDDPTDDHDLADLAALADGSLPAERRAAREAGGAPAPPPQAELAPPRPAPDIPLDAQARGGAPPPLPPPGDAQRARPPPP